MKTILVGLSMLAVAATSRADTEFFQDFSAGAPTTNYVSAAAPTNGQFNAISTSGSAKAYSISSNALMLASTGANAAFASRTTDFATTPTALAFTFDFNLTAASSTAITSAVELSFGSGFSTGNSTDANSAVYAKFGISLTAAGGYLVRDISGSTNGATTFTGANTITFVLNNSGSSIAYTAPDGSNESIANDTFDLFVGTSRQLNDRAVTTASQTLTDFKFGAAGSGTYTYTMDNISVADLVPEPSTYAVVLMGAGMTGLVMRRKVARA